VECKHGRILRITEGNTSFGVCVILAYFAQNLMCDVKVKDRVPSKELRERLGIDDIILTLKQNRL